jgi:uncharacterized membrane protein
MAPINNQAIITGFVISIPVIFGCLIFTIVRNALNNANAVNAADPIANHLPMAAVVFQTASSLSVIFLTSFGSSAISAIPHALSDIGQYASTAS